MYFIGELALLALALWCWTEDRKEKYFFYILLLAWVIGKLGEADIRLESGTWHYSFSRILILLGIWGWSWQRAKRRFWILLLPTLSFLIGDLFMINEPGLIPAGTVVIYAGALLLCWLAASSYWELVAAYTGADLIKLSFTPYLYHGLVHDLELPDPFLWNFTVLSLIAVGIVKTLIIFKES